GLRGRSLVGRQRRDRQQDGEQRSQPDEAAKGPASLFHHAVKGLQSMDHRGITWDHGWIEGRRRPAAPEPRRTPAWPTRSTSAIYPSNADIAIHTRLSAGTAGGTTGTSTPTSARTTSATPM